MVTLDLKLQSYSLSSLCDYSGAYMLGKRRTTITADAGPKPDLDAEQQHNYWQQDKQMKEIKL